ncbi:hypothetical protein DFH06DRAFT_1247461 [Mycena polygramma]|nr:hypothetical protein DFH06DRAFT_1247461 [Mycena polygramma]
MRSEKTAQMKTAIVGVATQLPSGDSTGDDLDYRSFWRFLADGGQAHQPLSPSLFSSSEFGVLQDKLSLPVRGAFLKKHDALDAAAFGISARDARVMPFTTRRLIELSFDALSDSGIDYRKRKIGCFMSGISNFEVSGALSTEGSFASIPSAPANRISYVLGITGPSVQLDTACNSSLTALHLAILAMEAGDCTAALVGAAQINREVAEWKNYCLSGVLSSSGITKPFDAGADGFGRGEGAAVVVLKPLEHALRDNDPIYSVILGSAINSTGSLMPLSVPSGLAQKDCIQTAYARAGRHPTDADFAELHITGTSVGDPIEANAAGEIFARKEYLDVGTVKGNLGHLEVAAFLVSLLKACLILEKKTIPPTVNLSTPSPAIDWARHRLHVPTEPKPLSCRSPSGLSIVSLSGAGIGGSTGHVVVESAPTRVVTTTGSTADFLVTVVAGGLSPRAVSQICESIRNADFSNIADMRACATTLSRRARQLPWRTYFVLPIHPHTEILPATLVPTSPPPLVLIFSGQGPQNVEMGRALFSSFPVFRATIVELDDVYRRVVGESLLETTGLFVSPSTLPAVSLSQTGWPVTVTVAAIAMLQMALFDLLVSTGITPSSFAGHSAGETAILYTSGAGPKAMALEIAIARGQSMTATESENLGMASLACGADVAKEIISQLATTDGTLEISCFNSPSSVALSGSARHLREAVALAQSRGIFAQRIRTMVPGHSSYMDKIKDDYLARMIDIFSRYPGPHVPHFPVFSTCTGETLVDEFSPAYFWDNCRKPVLFSQAISSILAFYDVDSHSNPVFLEISCHPVLSSSITQHGVAEKYVLCPMRRSTQGQGGDEAGLFTETLAQTVLLGYNLCDFSGLYGPSDYWSPSIDHPWVYRSIPSPEVHFFDVQSTSAVNGLLSTSISINEHTHPRLAQHVINGEPILPATGFIEILLEAGANFFWDVEFLSFFSLSGRNSAPMILERSGCEWSLKSMNTGPVGSTTKDHARGLMDSSLPAKSAKSLDLESLWDRLPKLEMEGFYQSIQPFATFGPAYRRVVRCHGSPTEVIAQIRCPSPEESSAKYRLDPVALDACLHIMLHPAISKQHGAGSMYLPSKLGRFVYHGRGSSTRDWFSHMRRRAWYPDSKSYDVVIADELGDVICEFHDLLVWRLSAQPAIVRRRLDLIFQPVALPTTIVNFETTYSHRDRQHDEDTLYAILDSLALKMITKSLDQKITVGGDVSRQRYFEFARGALQGKAVKTHDTLSDSEMRNKYPAHFEVTARMHEVHRTVFQSSKTAVNVLYTDDLMSRFYSRDSQTSTVYPEAVKSFSSILDSIRSGGKQAIDILEVGAGTGLLTKYLVEVLQKKPELLAEYTVTDASYALAADLARTIQYSKIIPKIYDLTKDTSHQGFLPESYDVIVGLHVLHAVPDISSCLSSLKRLLVPGGYLLVIEIDGESWGEKVGSVWFDCVFGSFSELGSQK